MVLFLVLSVVGTLWAPIAQLLCPATEDAHLLCPAEDDDELLDAEQCKVLTQ